MHSLSTYSMRCSGGGRKYLFATGITPVTIVLPLEAEERNHSVNRAKSMRLYQCQTCKVNRGCTSRRHTGTGRLHQGCPQDRIPRLRIGTHVADMYPVFPRHACGRSPKTPRCDTNEGGAIEVKGSTLVCPRDSGRRAGLLTKPYKIEQVQIL